jgi:hypothetical protein
MISLQKILVPIAFAIVMLPTIAVRANERDPLSETAQSFVRKYCLECHGSIDRSGDFDVETMLTDPVALHSADWERAIKKLRARQMPPPDGEQPDQATRSAVVQQLEHNLDQLAAAHPRPGRTSTFRRLTLYEYQNAIRDLLSLDIDVVPLLPADQVSHGFDNVTAGELSAVRLNRYLSAAQKISRLAVGRPQSSLPSRTIRIPPDVTQEQHVEGLPLGTRGGTVFLHNFPQDGEYEFSIRLTRDRNEHVEGLREPHELELLIDSRAVESFVVRPPGGRAAADDPWEKKTHANVDKHLRVRLPITAGPHRVGVTFLKNPSSLLETRRQPLHVQFNMYRHPRTGPAIYQVSIVGPHQAAAAGDTPSRRKVFSCRPADPAENETCANTIISNLMRRGCRRSITQEDLRRPLAIYRQAAETEGFEAGIEAALSYILISPEFLFRVERDPSHAEPGTVYPISDFELASRLSFFLWSSIPDQELLNLAEQGRLSDSAELRRQTQRMLEDDRSAAMVENFAAQWLQLRKLDAVQPDARLFPDFDDNLRRAFRRETELFFESVIREDRSVLDLLRADYTFLNERLAKHYDIPHVYGSQFRRVMLDPDSKRGGLLRHGSILSVTSYATRTSPVIRGTWVLENLIGTPPPPPPPNVPALTDNHVSARLSVRERLARHRADPACASCHRLIDPVGFSLENFDAIGRWRAFEDGRPVDAVGGLPGDTQSVGVAGLEAGLISHPEMFVGTMVEKLMTYAFGRGIEHDDAPAIRKILRNAKPDNYRFASLIHGIVASDAFQMRTSQ